MCELPGDKMQAAMDDEMRKVDVMAKTLRGIDALFAPHFARAEAQAAKIQRAAQAASEPEDGDVEPWSAQP